MKLAIQTLMLVLLGLASTSCSFFRTAVYVPVETEADRDIAQAHEPEAVQTLKPASN